MRHVDERVEVRLHPDALADEPRVIRLERHEIRRELRIIDEVTGLTAVYVLVFVEFDAAEYLFDHLE